MCDLYRFEVCSVCRVVRLGLVTIAKNQRARNGADRPEYVSGVEVWPEDFCEPCRKEYDEQVRPR